jgi:DNA-directed RNA polymerase subunit RPC12/RpoP
MEIQDDDPDHFEFILKYMYTHCFDAAAIKTLAAGNSARRITIPLEIYLVADKYNLPTSIFKDIVSDAASVLHGQYTLNELLSLVPVCYGMISEVAHPFGTLLVEEILGEFRRHTASDDFTNMVETYPVFGADVALQLGKKRMSYYCGRCQGRDEVLLPAALEDMKYDCPACSGKAEDLFLSTSFECR